MLLVYAVVVQQVEWSVNDGLSAFVRGFKLRYQAVGSSVVQYSHLLGPASFSHDITRLHENTAYDICVRVVVDLPVRATSEHG